VVQQINIRLRLVIVTVEASPSQLATVECSQKIVLLQHASTSTIDDICPVLHLVEVLGRHFQEVFVRNMNADKISRSEHIIHRLGDRGVVIDLDINHIVRDDFHSQRHSLTSQALTNTSKSNDTESASGQLNTLVLLLIPLILTEGHIRGMSPTSEVEHVHQHQFRNTIG